MPFFEAENGPEAGRRYPLTGDPYILGRHPECDIVIDVGAVSRHHCRVFLEGSEYFCEDLRSRNGTFLNDALIEGPQRLRHGDRLRICDVVFVFCERNDAPERMADDSSSRAVVVDDNDASSSTIMSKVGVLASRSGPQLTATAEAKLNALLEITKSLGQALSLDQVAGRILDSLFRIFVQADRGFIGLLDHKGVLVPRWTKLRRADSDETIRVSRTIARQVMDSKEAILSADAASDARFEMSQSIADFRIRSVMCAPLLDNEARPMGILQLDTLDQRQRFQEEDLELLISTATQAALRIVNARLHEESLRQRTLERDLALAREVQRTFLPNSRPDLEGYEFYDYYQAANHIGGDYFDYVRLPNGRLAVLVADVVGHGIAAALLMAKLSTEARFCLASQSHPASAFTELNARICELNLNRFITCVMAVVNPDTHEVAVVNAGHMAPLHRRRSGQLEEPSREESGPPLGVTEGTQFRQVEFALQPGESLTMYTDGLHEAMDASGRLFSLARLRQQVLSSDGSPESIGRALLENVRRHVGDRPQDDDMCLVSLGRKG